jgi:hypothetical protein
VVPGSCARAVTRCAEVRVKVSRRLVWVGSGRVGVEKRGAGMTSKFKSRFAKQGPDEQLEVLYNSKPFKKD